MYVLAQDKAAFKVLLPRLPISKKIGALKCANIFKLQLIQYTSILAHSSCPHNALESHLQFISGFRVCLRSCAFSLAFSKVCLFMHSGEKTKKFIFIG